MQSGYVISRRRLRLNFIALYYCLKTQVLACIVVQDLMPKQGVWRRQAEVNTFRLAEKRQPR